MVFIIAQYHIRRYYNIDPRVWFFVVFGISLIGFFVVFGIFYSEVKSMENYFKTHSFFDFASEIAGKIKPIIEKIKPITEKVVNSFLYTIISCVCTLISFTGIMYKIFFYEDFIARTTIYVIYLVMIACALLSYVLGAIVIEKEKRTKKFVYIGMWTFIFLANFLDFVCI